MISLCQKKVQNTISITRYDFWVLLTSFQLKPASECGIFSPKRPQWWQKDVTRVPEHAKRLALSHGEERPNAERIYLFSKGLTQRN